MVARFRHPPGRIAALVAAACLFAYPASARPVRLSTRYAAVIAHYDSTVGVGNPDRLAQWIAATEAAAPGDSDLRVVTGLQRSRLLMQQGRQEAARPLARAALERARTTGDTLLECRALYVLASADALTGHDATARPMAARLVNLARRARLRRDEGFGDIVLAYLDLLAERFPGAERGYRAALRRLSPSLDVIPARIAKIGLARACFQLGRTEEARALDIELIRESRRVDDPINESMALNNLAVHDLMGGDPAEALPCYERAVMLQRRLGRWREATTTATNLADALVRMMRFDEAAAVLEAWPDSVTARLPAWQRADVLAVLANVRLGQERLAEAESLAVRAWALCDSAHTRPGRELAAGRATLMSRRGAAVDAVALLDRWVAGLPAGNADPDDALMLRAEAAFHLCSAGHYDESLRRWGEVCAAIDTTTALGHLKLGFALVNESLAASGARDPARARRAFRAGVHEWERGRLSYHSAQWREVLEVQGLRAWGSSGGALLAGRPGAPDGAGARETFDLLQHVKARTLDDRIAGAPSPPVTVSLLQRAVLREGELVLDVYPAYDSVLVFAVTTRVLRPFVLREPNELSKRIDRFAKLARDGSSGSEALRASSAGALSLALLGPVSDLLAHARRLVVSGGGVLDDVPWALLPLPGTDRPLIGRVDVAGVPSLSVLSRLRSGAARPAVRGPLVIAGPRGPDGRRLDGVAREVEFLTGRYASADVRTPRSGADLRAALDAIRGAEVVHVAAHFEHDPGDPWRSGMLLGDARRDGSWVRATTLGALRTGARLVVLAGCSSAGAQGQGLQGERGMATAFMAAGAQAVLGTLWPVEDGASAEFVRRFYAAMDAGSDAARALALAQSGMRTSDPRGDPSRWAAFVLLGDPAVRVSLARRAVSGLTRFGR